MNEQHPPLHPGFILKTEFLEPMGITPYALAKACFIPRSRIERIVRQQLGLSADTCLRLSKALGMSEQFFMNLQTHYELKKAKYEAGETLQAVQPILKAA